MQLFENVDLNSNISRYFDEDVEVSYSLLSDGARKMFQDYSNSKMTLIENPDDKYKMTCKLRLYADVFVSLNKLFSQESKLYADYIFPVLEAINNLFECNTTTGLLSLSLIDLPKLLSKNANVNLRAMVDRRNERKTPFRKHPAVLFFESLVVLLCLGKGKFQDGFLCDSIESFFKKFSVFNPDSPKETLRNQLRGKVSNLEMVKLFRSRMNDAQLRLLVRTHNVMALVVMMTKNKRFKACELSVRIAEGEHTQGFKPGGDNNARVIRLTLLHQLLNEKKFEFVASLPLASCLPPRVVDNLKTESVKTSMKKNATKTCEKMTANAKKSSGVAVVELDQRGSKKATKKPQEKKENGLTSKSQQGGNLSTASSFQQYFSPFPLCDEIDNAIMQTINDNFTAGSPSFGFSSSFSSSNNSVATLQIDYESSNAIASDHDCGYSDYDVDACFSQSLTSKLKQESRHPCKSDDSYGSESKIAPFLLSSTSGVSRCYESSFFN